MKLWWSGICVPSSLAHASLLRIWGCWPETPESWFGSIDVHLMVQQAAKSSRLQHGLLLLKSHGEQRAPTVGLCHSQETLSWGKPALCPQGTHLILQG